MNYYVQPVLPKCSQRSTKYDVIMAVCSMSELTCWCLWDFIASQCAIWR